MLTKKYLKLLNFNLQYKSLRLTGLLAVNLFLFSEAYAQEKQDYNWFWSSQASNGGGYFVSTSLQFDEGILNNILRDTTNINLGQNSAIVANTEGKLLFYSNGCQILQANHALMENGDSLNFGKYTTDFVANCKSGYRGWQDIIILDDPANDNGYYLVNKVRNYSLNPFKLYVEALKYSYIDMSFNDRKGKVIKKNEILLDKTYLNASFLSAIHHANGKDWWLIQMREYANTYYKFLINSEGIALRDSQNIGPATTRNTSSAGFAKFSPDGKRWAWYTVENGLNLFDFDRETGTLSNQKIMFIPHKVTFSGLEFSPNSRFIYISLVDSLMQVDTWKESLPYELIDVYDGFSDPLPATLHGMSLAPDCKIYMTSTNSTRSLSVINHPNKKGKDCDFVQHSIKLFFDNDISHPNFPRLRVDQADVCDSVELYTGAIEPGSHDLIQVYPSPIIDMVRITTQQAGALHIYNLHGRVMTQLSMTQAGDHYIDCSSWPSGWYVAKYMALDGSYVMRKIVKVDKH